MRSIRTKRSVKRLRKHLYPKPAVQLQRQLVDHRRHDTNNSAPLPVIINGLNVLNGHNPSMAISLLASSNTMGGNYEHCYSDDASAKNNGWLWTAEENSELQVNAQNKVFSCQERNTSDASANTDARLYAYASFLLTYNPTTNILWEAFGTPSNFHVFPEQQLVAMNPKVSAPSDIWA